MIHFRLSDDLQQTLMHKQSELNKPTADNFQMLSAGRKMSELFRQPCGDNLLLTESSYQEKTHSHSIQLMHSWRLLVHVHDVCNIFSKLGTYVHMYVGGWFCRLLDWCTSVWIGNEMVSPSGVWKINYIRWNYWTLHTNKTIQNGPTKVHVQIWVL